VNKLLFISHFFPPIGGAGVQRSVKFVKQLPSLGWIPLVLTGTGDSTGRWAPEDVTLAADVPPEAPVFRANITDTSKNTRLEAFRRLGKEIIEQHHPHLIFVTMSPFSDAHVASMLSAKYGIPWVADLRDPWALDEFQVYRTRWHRRLERRRMRAALRTASRVIMNTPEASKRFREAFPELAGRAHTSITNGYDQEDFSGKAESIDPSHFTIVHSGYFHAELGLRQKRRALEYRILGRTEPGVEFLPRSHYYLLQALERWKQTDPEATRDVRVVCLGSATPVDETLVRSTRVSELFRFTGYLPHAECLKWVRGADLLFLPMHKLPPGRRATIVPGKTYEYLASLRPILGAVPEGDAKDFLASAGGAYICGPDDVDTMLNKLRTIHARWRDPKSRLPARNRPTDFERKKLAIDLAAVLDALIG
jgi:hypothetical protein